MSRIELFREDFRVRIPGLLKPHCLRALVAGVESAFRSVEGLEFDDVGKVHVLSALDEVRSGYLDNRKMDVDGMLSPAVAAQALRYVLRSHSASDNVDDQPCLELIRAARLWELLTSHSPSTRSKLALEKAKQELARYQPHSSEHSCKYSVWGLVYLSDMAKLPGSVVSLVVTAIGLPREYLAKPPELQFAPWSDFDPVTTGLFNTLRNAFQCLYLQELVGSGSRWSERYVLELAHAVEESYTFWPIRGDSLGLAVVLAALGANQSAEQRNVAATGKINEFLRGPDQVFEPGKKLLAIHNYRKRRKFPNPIPFVCSTRDAEALRGRSPGEENKEYEERIEPVTGITTWDDLLTFAYKFFDDGLKQYRTVLSQASIAEFPQDLTDQFPIFIRHFGAQPADVVFPLLQQFFASQQAISSADRRLPLPVCLRCPEPDQLDMAPTKQINTLMDRISKGLNETVGNHNVKLDALDKRLGTNRANQFVVYSQPSMAIPSYQDERNRLKWFINAVKDRCEPERDLVFIASDSAHAELIREVFEISQTPHE